MSNLQAVGEEQPAGPLLRRPHRPRIRQIPVDLRDKQVLKVITAVQPDPTAVPLIECKQPHQPAPHRPLQISPTVQHHGGGFDTSAQRDRVPRSPYPRVIRAIPPQNPASRDGQAAWLIPGSPTGDIPRRPQLSVPDRGDPARSGTRRLAPGTKIRRRAGADAIGSGAYISSRIQSPLGAVSIQTTRELSGPSPAACTLAARPQRSTLPGHSIGAHH